MTDELAVGDSPSSSITTIAPSSNIAGTTASAMSTAVGQADHHSNVPAVPIEDSPPVSLSLPHQMNGDPSVQAPAKDNYTAGNNVQSGSGLIGRLHPLRATMKFPVRESLRPNQQEKVNTNYFEITVDPSTVFYEYRILGMAENEKRKTKRRFMETVIEHVPFLKCNQDSFATDYVDTIIAWRDLHSLATGPKVGTYDANIPDSADEWRLIDVIDRQVTAYLNLRLKGTVDIAAFKAYVGSNHANPAGYNLEPTKRALHIIMTKCIHNPGNIVHLNANKFFVTHAFLDLKARGDQLETLRAIRGYYYKIVPGMGNILLNVSPVTSAFWNPHTVSDVMDFGLDTFGRDLYALKGLQVRIMYERGKDAQSRASSINDEHSRIKRIRGFGKALNQQKFNLEILDTQGNVTNTQTTIVSDYIEQSKSSKKY
jgi:eukaryotic translation initiation factor 2C